MATGIGIVCGSPKIGDRLIPMSKLPQTLFWSSEIDVELSKLSEVLNFLDDEYPTNGGDQIWSDDYFQWKLSEMNPSGRGFLSLARAGNQIVGTASLTKKRALLNGIEILAGEVGDTYTLPSILRNGRPAQTSSICKDKASYINRSVFGRLISETTKHGFLNGLELIYGTPNLKSYPGYIKRLGYIPHDEYSNTTYYRPRAQLLLNGNKMSKGLMYLCNRFDNAMNGLRKSIHSPRGVGVAVQKNMPERTQLDALWQKSKPESGFSLIRDFLYWEYRYKKHPLADYDFFLFTYSHELQAIAVCRKFRNKNDYQSLAIVEWMKKPLISLDFVFCEILNYYRHDSIDYFYTWAGSEKESQVTLFKQFFWRKRPAPLIFYRNEVAVELIRQNKPLCFQLGNSDAI